MPGATRHHALARQWELLKALPSTGAGKTALELTEALRRAGFEVSKRTVERDLRELTALFAIQCNEKSMPFGWRWMPGQGASLPAVSVAEALSLRIIEDLLRPLLPDAVLASLESRFRQARDKLEALAEQNATARWVEKVRHVPPALPLLAPQIPNGVLTIVQEALLHEEQLEAGYCRFGHEEPLTITLHPLALVQRGPTTYLVATAYDYEDPRLYAVHRIVAARRTPVPARRPKGFSLDQYIEDGGLQFGNGKRVRLELHLDEGLARVLTETPLSADQSLVSGRRGWRLTASVIDTMQLRWWLMAQGERVEVIKPSGLRKEIAYSHRVAAARYGRHELDSSTYE